MIFFSVLKRIFYNLDGLGKLITRPVWNIH